MTLDPNSPPTTARRGKDKQVWAGYALSGLAVLGLGASGVFKVQRAEGAVAGFTQFGYPTELLSPIGAVELLCAALYALPQTSLLGAILSTAYLGGAVATHVRVGDAFVSPIIVAVILWCGLWLRSPRLRALVPLTSAEK